jgi:hypothetical protein
VFRKKNDCDIRRKVWNWGKKCGRILEEGNGGEEVKEKDGE